MLLELARWLHKLESFFGLFGYITFRGILAALTALFLSLWIGPAVIRRLREFMLPPIACLGFSPHRRADD